MSNSFASNITRKLAKVILKSFESKRVLSKNVNTQLLDGKFNPSSGDTVDFKRPTDYVSVRTSNGDVSGATPSDIITGKASGVVQDYFTALVEFDEADQAIKMDQQKQLVEMPMIDRIVTDLELDYAGFMAKNTALMAGTFGTPATTWNHVAGGSAILEASGVPKDGSWYYTINPFTQTNLASNTVSLGAGGDAGKLVSDAYRSATIKENFAGMDVMTATTLSSYTTDSESDRVGALASNPDVTYLAAKDTMTQTLAVSGMGADLEVRAGETITIAGRYRLNLRTRQPILDENGSRILWSGTVTTAVTLSGTGTGNIVVTGPAIYESGGAYNTVDSAPVSGDVVTILGSASSIYQPNLFWHKQAFSIGSVPMKKLYSTDTIATTADGLQFRVSFGTGFLENQQKIRVDLRPAYACLNPFFAGKGWGTA